VKEAIRSLDALKASHDDVAALRRQLSQRTAELDGARAARIDAEAKCAKEAARRIALEAENDDLKGACIGWTDAFAWASAWHSIAQLPLHAGRRFLSLIPCLRAVFRPHNVTPPCSPAGEGSTKDKLPHVPGGASARGSDLLQSQDDPSSGGLFSELSCRRLIQELCGGRKGRIQVASEQLTRSLGAARRHRIHIGHSPFVRRSFQLTDRIDKASMFQKIQVARGTS
jgi:hypothetical protein